MIILTSEEMREADRSAAEDCGFPPVLLMESAAVACAKVIKEKYPSARRILVLAGKGNNGGDGIAVARLLRRAGFEPEIQLTSSERLSELAQLNLNLLLKTAVCPVRRPEAFSKKILENVDLIVDSMFGTGFSGSMTGICSDIAEAANSSGRPVVSVDVPSGLNADTGKVSGICIKADVTVTMGYPKRGFFLYPGSEQVGELYVADIGFPDNTDSVCSFADSSSLCDWMPHRRKNDWKGSAGRLFILAGSNEYTGAACLACRAAMRCGSGMVYLAVPEKIHHVMAEKLTEAIIVPYSENDYSSIFQALEKSDAAAIGPGLGTSEFTADLLKTIFSRIRIPVVADADALYPEILCGHKISRLVITPHIGEAARLTDKTVAEIKSDLVNSALEAAEQYNCISVLKGPNSIIALPDGYFYFNISGSEVLASAGSGDVLTGIIGALLARGCFPEECSVLGCFIHGAAGDSVAAEKGRLGITASDVIEYIPRISELLLNGDTDAIDRMLKIKKISVI